MRRCKDDTSMNDERMRGFAWNRERSDAVGAVAPIIGWLHAIANDSALVHMDGTRIRSRTQTY